MKVLGVSGSPIKNSNTDRALKLALESTGLKTELIKLKDPTLSVPYRLFSFIKTRQIICERHLYLYPLVGC